LRLHRWHCGTLEVTGWRTLRGKAEGDEGDGEGRRRVRKRGGATVRRRRWWRRWWEEEEEVVVGGGAGAASAMRGTATQDNCQDVRTR
jgi:hypothetical protein